MRKRKKHVIDKYLTLIENIYDEKKISSFEDTINSFKTINDHFDKYETEDLIYLKIELDGILEDLKQVAVLVGFMSIALSIILLFLNSTIEFITSIFSDQNVILPSQLKYGLVVITGLYIILSFGRIVMRYSIRYRRLNIVKNVLNNHIENREK